MPPDPVGPEPVERWYGPFQDGCSYFWDGLGFADYDCSESSVYGWYGPYEDGCLYLWDGYRFIASDCSAGGTTRWPPPGRAGEDAQVGQMKRAVSSAGAV